MIELNFKLLREDFTLDIQLTSQAKSLALCGNSGAGKTSILHAIAGLITPHHGRIVVDHTVLFDADTSYQRPTHQRSIGYVFQDTRLFPHLKVKDNLAYGAKARKVFDPLALKECASWLELDSLLSRYPHQLSGGERQRVALGRALLSQPRLLLLDEPLNGLHQAARQTILRALNQLKDNASCSMIFVSHHHDEVTALAEEQVMLNAGCVIEHLKLRGFC